MIQVEINNKCVTMELDTGAIMSEKSYHSLFPDLQLDESNIKLKSYSGQTIPVVGQANVAVKYGQQEKTLPLLVVQDDGHTLFGRNWLFAIKLNWEGIHSVRYSPLESVLECHQPVFKKRLGKLKDYEAKINVDSRASLRFCRAHPVPYALSNKVELELECLRHYRANTIYRLGSSNCSCF